MGAWIDKMQVVHGKTLAEYKAILMERVRHPAKMYRDLGYKPVAKCIYLYELTDGTILNTGYYPLCRSLRTMLGASIKSEEFWYGDPSVTPLLFAHGAIVFPQRVTE